MSDERALVALIRERIDALGLDLRGFVVGTEAATGHYACTPVIAAMAGADHVHAVGRDSWRYGSIAEAEIAVLRLAKEAGVETRISIARRFGPGALGRCDILTNSGAVRPIDRRKIGRLRPDAVIALMFEAWEFRKADIDAKACAARGVRIAAVDERHPAVGVFAFLGLLAARLVEMTGVEPAAARVAVLCDNDFAPYLAQGLAAAGAEASIFRSCEEAAARGGAWNVVLVALDPARNPPLGAAALAGLRAAAPDARLAQLWGDIDRAAARRAGFPAIAPETEPAPGHMGVLLSSLGPEPVVRLQAGGLKAAEEAIRGVASGRRPVHVPLAPDAARHTPGGR